MPTSVKMPALSPTMESGTLSKWLVKEGDTVSAGDLLAEIETDKATMEFEAVDEGVVSQILVPAGTSDVKVGTVIAMITGEDEEEAQKPAQAPKAADPAPVIVPSAAPVASSVASPAVVPVASTPSPGNRVKASPLARRIAQGKGIDLSTLAGSGPGGRIVRSDLDGAAEGTVVAPAPRAAANAGAKPAAGPVSASTQAILDERIPHSIEKLSGMRKTIARRLTESMQQAPHIYLTVDIRLDKLLALRGELNAALEKRGVKLSVNDLLIKALGLALIEVPKCNVAFAGDELISYSRADISVAVSIPGGLITPIIQNANGKSLSDIANGMKDLAARAKEGRLKPDEYMGGTASLSNMGMFGIKHFTAVINPPQSTILAIGAGEQRPYVTDGQLGIATVMSATGSFDHRAIDGADGAQLMAAFKNLVENPLGMLA